MEQISVLLDTDIGSDIDDAVALAYLLRQPRCQLLGVTTVSGDVSKRAACVEIICREAGKTNLPIHCGAANPILWGPGQPNVPQYEAIKNRLHKHDWKQNNAVRFLRDTIHRLPGEVTLLSIGPLTNIALLFAIDPEIPSLLKGFVSMSGAFYATPPYSEWNCKVDSLATRIVYEAKVRDHLNIGTDVTMKCKLTKEQVRESFKAPPLNIALEMAEVWFSGDSDSIIFHDPLAAALIFNPSLCEIERGTIISEVSESHDIGGITHFTPSEEGPHLVAKTVDVDGFFNEFFGVFPKG